MPNTNPPRTANQPLAVSLSEAARLLSVSRSTIYRLIENGDLQAVRLTDQRCVRIPTAAINALLEGGAK